MNLRSPRNDICNTATSIMYWDKILLLVYAIMAYLKINAESVAILRCSSVLSSALNKLQLSVFQFRSFTHDHPLTSFSVIWSPTGIVLNSLRVKHDNGLTPTVLLLSKFHKNQGSRFLWHVGIYMLTVIYPPSQLTYKCPAKCLWLQPTLALQPHSLFTTFTTSTCIIYPTFLHGYLF